MISGRKFVIATTIAAVCAFGGVVPWISRADGRPAGKDFSKPAIVILGYGLLPNGAMRGKLYERVLTGLAVANMFPQSPVIVTGGNPQNGITEAEQMHNTLVNVGFPDDRIIVEPHASSTVENAQFAVPLAKQAGCTGVILVTNSTHQQRADQDFVDAGATILATVSFPDGDMPTNIKQFVRDVISPLT